MISIIYPILALIGLVTIRRFWVMYSVESYQLKVFHYTTMNQLEEKMVMEMHQFWPVYYAYYEIWNWDFTKYIVHLDHYEKMKKFIDQELSRKDLDNDTFQRELAIAQKSEVKD